MSEGRRQTVLCTIPYFRCGPWLDRCLASLAAQTRPPDGVVVLADGGDLPPLDILSRYPDFGVLVSMERVGPYALVQSIIEQTAFDWYMFQDADDWSSADRLEIVLALAEATGAALFGTQVIRVFEEDGSAMSVGVPLDVNAPLAEAPDHMLLHPTSILRPALFVQAGGFATALRFGGDTEFLLRAHFLGRVVNSDRACYFKRIRSDALTTAAKTGHGSPARNRVNKAFLKRAWTNLSRHRLGVSLDLSPLKTRPRVELRPPPGAPMPAWLADALSQS